MDVDPRTPSFHSLRTTDGWQPTLAVYTARISTWTTHANTHTTQLTQLAKSPSTLLVNGVLAMAFHMGLEPAKPRLMPNAVLGKRMSQGSLGESPVGCAPSGVIVPWVATDRCPMLPGKLLLPECELRARWKTRRGQGLIT